MIAERILFTIVALTAAAAAAAVAVFGTAFAIYALLREVLTPAGAAAVMALTAALFAALVGLFAASKLKFKLAPTPKAGARSAASRRDGRAQDAPSLMERVVEIVRERPFVAAGAAVAAGLIALRNPVIVTALIKALLDPPKRRDGRR